MVYVGTTISIHAFIPVLANRRPVLCLKGVGGTRNPKPHGCKHEFRVSGYVHFGLKKQNV